MEDPSYFIYQARKIQESVVIDDKPPKELIKRIRETKPSVLARMLWDNRKNLTEGTRKFVQPDDLINRSIKPDDTLTTKKSSKYPNPPEEPEKKADFPHRNEGAENPELLLHELGFPFGTKEGYSLGPSGATTTAEGFGDMGLGGAQPDPLQSQQQPQMSSPEPEPDTALGSPLGPVGPEGLDSLWEPVQAEPLMIQDPNMMGQQQPIEGQNLNEPQEHICPVCKEPHKDEPELTNHLAETHRVYEKIWPFRQREGMPAATYPYGG